MPLGNEFIWLVMINLGSRGRRQMPDQLAPTSGSVLSGISPGMTSGRGRDREPSGRVRDAMQGAITRNEAWRIAANIAKLP